jgi:hypothetical protein
MTLKVVADQELRSSATMAHNQGIFPHPFVY